MLLVVLPAFAYETDQLTWRDRQLVDATATANALLAPMLAEAVARANERTRCGGDDDAVRRVLAEEIHAVTSRRHAVASRGVLRSPGFSRYTAALEESDADRFAFAHREDLYGSISVWRSVVLATAGPCSTYEIGGVRLGSDKLDHFLDTGFHYFVGPDPDAMVERGTAMERSIYGLLTSKTFSWADLAANWDGFRFYAGLLGPGSSFGRDRDGCVVEREPFDWTRWVSTAWDETLNPPVYTRLVENGVLHRLERERDEVCTSKEHWDPDGSRERALAVLDPHPPYVAGPTPSQRDPWQLEALCDPARTAPLAPWPIRPHVEVREGRSEGSPRSLYR